MLADDSAANRHTHAIARLGLLERAGDPALTEPVVYGDQCARKAALRAAA